MRTDTVAYRVSDLSCAGSLVYDEAAGPRPLVLMVPDWMGATEQANAVARRIAGNKFAVFVADMYGAGARPQDAAQADALSAPLKADVGEMRRRAAGALAAGEDEARRRGLLAEGRLGAIGFCFGGTAVLELSRAGAPLSAAISVHGELATPRPATPGAIRPALLVLHGSADPVAPKAQRDAFEAEMTGVGARWSMMTFGSAVHSFTDPAAAIAGVAQFDETAARWAFAMTDMFLTEELAAAVAVGVS